jgi:hypothetical protein
MVVAIIDTITTIAEVCLLQGHNMNTIADAAAARIFSDDMISTVINNVIRYVYTKSDLDMEDTYGIQFAVNTLSVLSLNNIMAEAGYLENWEIVDPFNRQVLNNMIENKKEDQDQIDVIPMYRDRSML